MNKLLFCHQLNMEFVIITKGKAGNDWQLSSLKNNK